MAKKALTAQEVETYVGNLDAAIGWLMATATPANEANSRHLRNQLSEIAWYLRSTVSPDEGGSQ